ncbi:hypothetical protein COLU111180_06150 [Cohnella lubricantis]|uniref:Uncharacterized protein n=1 Tax=Cohnella lubricantis TaxID=2163172 RepID=A0A841TE83_9BACL|nr:hypothetical protein [Cohnella lubricantis]MBB6677540.1 hypothetical protein [Cohnella lubricantis]MBP2116574.1 hypothetical protein [Cohnella lubricantis]
MIGDSELQLIQRHIVLQEMVRLTEDEIRRIRESRMPLRGAAERLAKTTLAGVLLELGASREQLRANRIWVADKGMPQGEDMLVYRYSHQGRQGTYPITTKGLREEVERQGELLADRWTQICDAAMRG